MHGRLRALTFAGAVAAIVLVGRGAEAYVRSVTDAGYHVPLYWSSGCETVTIYLNGFTAMTSDEVVKSIGGAAAAWSPSAVTCPAAAGDGGAGHPYFEILPQLSPGGAAPGDVNDSKNTIVFQTTTWDPDLDPAALAFTQVWRESSGQIIDADIEINATNPEFEWANLDPGAPPGMHAIPRYDLQTVMTHEFGHFLGLSHTCTTNLADDGNSPPEGSTDDQGQPIPTCDDTGVPQYAAVMWAIVESDSITKRVLSTDDARGVCAIYPPNSPTQASHACTQNLPDDGCGCAVERTTARTTAGPLAVFAFVVVALALARRRRGRRGPAASDR